jgi:CBS domain-containing protein
MFHIHGVQGRIFSGTLEQLRHHREVTGVAPVRRVTPREPGADPPNAWPEGGRGLSHEAVLAYGANRAPGNGHTRQPLTRAADVMRSPVHSVPAEATLREAWQVLALHGIGQAPVLDRSGALIGLVGRADLMSTAMLDLQAALAALARLDQPVTAVMQSPVPSTAPDTDLRRVAALLLDTGLPGVPVADDAGRVLGFVSRTDLLRALATDPPLDLWG